MEKIKKNFGPHSKRILAYFLCFAMIFTTMPQFAFAAQSGERNVIELYNYDELSSIYLSENEEAAAEYPNGAYMFPLSSMQLEMNGFYALDVFREGGTQGDSSITVKTVDLTARYGVDYEIYLGSDYKDKPVDGEANPYYDLAGYSFIATPTKTETTYVTNEGDDLDNVRADASEYNDESLELMPVSSEFTLKFKDGENSKRIYIKTDKKFKVTDDLEFALNLCEPENGSIGAQSSLAVSILERRDKPDTHLSISDVEVNPESEEAYIIVKRSGNMGTKGTFTVRTESATAKAGEAYEAVQMPLTFTAGMEEIKVPVKMLEGAEDGTYFNANLEDIENAVDKPQTAKVKITNSTEKEAAHQSTFTASESYTQQLGSSLVTTDTGERGVQIVDVSKFNISNVTERGTGSQDYSFSKSGSKPELYYSNGIASKNNAVSIRSNEKINFTGVKSVTMTIDNYSGSCDWDENMIYVSNSDKFNSDTGNYDWVSELDNQGIGDYWSMGNVADSVLHRTANLSQSAVKGERYLYIAMHKGAFAGECSFGIYNSGVKDVEKNVRLNMIKYNISIIEPDPVDIYVNGTMTSQAPASNHKLVDPAASSKNDNNTGTNFDIYRDETTAISAAKDSKFNGLVKLKGIYFCESGKTSNHSELYELTGDSFTLTAAVLEKYENYIKDNKIVIKPVYEVSESHLSVESFDNTSTTGQKFIADNTNCSGKFYYNNELVGTLSWTKSSRSNGQYMVADSLNFNFTFDSNASSQLWNMKLDTRAAATKSLLAASSIITVNNGTLSYNIQLSNVYFSVTPQFTLSDTTTQLVVTNPALGTVTGEDSKYATSTSTGSIIITGYTAKDAGKDTVFSDMSVNEIITFMAKPKNGYRAKWIYTDSATHKEQTYYGDTFFYVIQNPYFTSDNHVTLTYEKVPSGYKTYHFGGQTLIQEGSVINPPTSQTDTYNVAKGAQVTFGDYVALSNEDGEFLLETAPGEKTSTAIDIYGAADEVHRAMVFYNNQYFVCDIDFGDYLTSAGVTSISAKIKMPYQNTGVRPASIYARSMDGTLYGDTITLISANAVQFFMDIDTRGQIKDKPVNMVRWTIENDEGIKSTYDVDLENGATVAKWASTLSEVIKQGDKLYAELMWKGYDDDAEAIYTSYGKFDTGYNFIATAITETITYAPDIGVPVTMSKPTPVLGPLSPNFSIKGFTPIINAGTSGVDDEGREIHTITIGLSLGQVKNMASKDSKWGSASPLSRVKSMAGILDNIDKANNAGKFPKNAIGSSLSNSLHMKTAVNLSFTMTFCYQGSYYIDDTGQWLFTGHIGIIGAGGSIRVSIPFVLLYVPCFAYITASVDMTAFFGAFPRTDEATGTTTALTLEQLEDYGVQEMQGVYDLKIGLGVGVGIGYDALLSAQGGVNTNFDIQFNNYMRGYGTVSMGGSITLELLIFKASWSDTFFTMEMFNTLQDDISETAMRELQSKLEVDIMNNIKLGDMAISTSEPHSQTGRAASYNGAVIQGSSSIVNPEVMEIGGGKYLIVSTATSIEDDGTGTDNLLHYYIYDEANETLSEPVPVLRQAYKDYLNVHSAGADSVAAANILGDYMKLDSEPTMVDCGDDILIAWNKCMISTKTDDGNTEANHKLLNSVGISTIYYNKASGKFYNYKIITDKNKEYAFVSPKLAYNENTGEIQVFYQAMKTEGITADTTLAELQAKPTVLRTARYDADANNWSESQNVSINGEYLKYYDAAPYEDTIMLSYVSSDFSGFTLESTEGFSIDEGFDISDFNTENALFIKQFTAKDGELKAGKPIRLTDEGYVVANPEFVRLKGNLPTETVTGDSAVIEDDSKAETSQTAIDNTLLMYKCNGRYAYQNITNILTNGLYTDNDGISHIAADYAQPQFITDEDDYSINDDFAVYSNESGNIYALWTTSESNQQQIWTKQFVLDRIKKITERTVLDSDGQVTYDSSGNPVTAKLDNPIYLLDGYWGGKTYLTEPTEIEESGSVELIEGTGDGLGNYKQNFDALILDNGDILAVFNGFDKVLVEETDAEGNVTDVCKQVNNLFAVAEYDVSSKYELLGDIDCIDVSNEYPASGDTVTVTCYAKNSGIKSGRNVEVTLYANGEAVSSTTERVWLASDIKSFDFYYTLPEGVTAGEVSLYFTVTERGLSGNGDTISLSTASNPYTFNQGAKLDIANVILSPVSNVLSDDDSAKIKVKATVRNNGNEAYKGGDFVRLVEQDIRELAMAMEEGYSGNAPVLTSFGKEMIEPLAIGESFEIEFISDEIPASIFKKSGTDTAYLECIISAAGDEWTTRAANEAYTEISSFYPGVTRMPVAEKADSITLEDMNIQVGQSMSVSGTVAPAAALVDGKVVYSSSDESVVLVDSNGVVTGVSEGKATITASIDGISASATVTVAGKYVPGDNPGGNSGEGDIPLIPDTNVDTNPAETGDDSGNSIAIWMLVGLIAFVAAIEIADRKRRKC